MKNAVLLHGTGGSNTDYFWFADTKEYLEKLGFSVSWPLLPNTEKPNLTDSLKYVQKHLTLDRESIIIAHSSGCPLALSWLQRTSQPIRQTLLVAGFYQNLHDDGYSELMLEQYDWSKIQASSTEILLLNSDNDPWGCTYEQAKMPAKLLAAPLIIMPGQGHMGSISFNQPYKKFNLLNRLIVH